jgi:undecaprenyl-diphosphatase
LIIRREHLKRISSRLLNIEIRVILSVLLVVTSMWIFFLVADAVDEGTTKQFDVKIIKLLRSDDLSPAGPYWLPDFMRDITSLGGGSVIALFTLIVVIYLLMRKKYNELLLVLAAVIGGAIVGMLLKEYFGRERPDLIFRLVETQSLSFPSGHSMMSTVIYLSLAALLARIHPERKVRIYIVTVALFLAFIIGISRIYLGVHYPTDVIGGWTIGLVWASLCWFGAKYLQRKRVVEQPVEK